MKKHLTRFRELILRSLFAGNLSQYDIAFCRIAFFGAMLIIFSGFQVEDYAHVPKAFHLPNRALGWFGIPRPQQPWILWLKYLWLGAIAFSAIGLLTRVSTSICFVLSFYILAQDWSFGNTHHSHHLVVVFSGIFALSRCGQSLSLDRKIADWLESRGHHDVSLSLLGPLSDERWVVRLCQLCWCLFFFNAAIAKLRHGGFSMLVPENFQNIVLYGNYWYGKTAYPFQREIQAAVLNSDTLAGALGVLGLASEVLAPCAFFIRTRWKFVFVVLIAGLQIFAFVLFQVRFLPMIATYLVWVPWSSIAERIFAFKRE